MEWPASGVRRSSARWICAPTTPLPPGLALSGCRRKRRVLPTGTGVHCNGDDISRKLKNADFGEFNPPELSETTSPPATKRQEIKRDEALKNTIRSQPGSIYIWLGHGTMAILNSQRTFAETSRAAEKVVKEWKIVSATEALKRGSADAQVLNQELVKATYRSRCTSSMKLDEAKSRHLQEA